MRPGEVVQGGPWDGFEVISVYGDEQALEDGVLVDISGLRLSYRGRAVTRMSRALFEDFQPFVSQGPDDLLPSLRSVLVTKFAHARDNEGDGVLLVLPGGGPADDRIWAVANEHDGFTLMYPSDY